MDGTVDEFLVLAAKQVNRRQKRIFIAAVCEKRSLRKAQFAKSAATAAHEKRKIDLDGAVKQSSKDCLKEAVNPKNWPLVR